MGAAKDLDSAGRPDAWSISYGWPEEWQCGNHTNRPALQPAAKACASLGYDSAKYIGKAEMYLAMLAAGGVTVLAASGDSGSTGFASNNPTDTHRAIEGKPPSNEACTLWGGGGGAQCEDVFFAMEINTGG